MLLLPLFNKVLSLQSTNFLFKIDAIPEYFHPPFSYELLSEKEKFKNIADEMDQTFAELAGY